MDTCPGCKVDQATGYEEWRNAAWTFVAERIARLGLCLSSPPMPEADQNAGAELVFVGLRVPASIVQRFIGSGNRVK